MIPATHWADGEDGTAWWVPFLHDGDPDIAPDIDRPCDACVGTGVERRPDGEWEPPCPDCDGTGRHTFDVKVEPYPYGGCPSCGDSGIGRAGDGFCSSCMYPDRHRVSVVEGMVLPIHGEGDNHDGDLPHVCHSDGYLFPMPDGDDTVSGFPMPAAAPGMWAIKVRKADR